MDDRPLKATVCRRPANTLLMKWMWKSVNEFIAEPYDFLIKSSTILCPLVTLFRPNTYTVRFVFIYRYLQMMYTNIFTRVDKSYICLRHQFRHDVFFQKIGLRTVL